MDNDLFSTFSSQIRDMADSELIQEISKPRRVLIDGCMASGRAIEVAYAPFDQVNREARIIIAGLTPGRQQMRNALIEARRQLRSGRDDHDAKIAAKVFASFSGPMRTNLVAMLDSVGVNELLGINSTESLWNGNARLVHFTSVLRYPVFVNGQNYSGTPSILAVPSLRAHLMRWFAAEMKALPNAIVVPLGPQVTVAIEAIAGEIGIDGSRTLSGLPHPSGANAERIAFFLGRKARDVLSVKVDPDKLIAARTSLEAKLSRLRISS